MEYLNLHTHKFTSQPNVLELVNLYPHDFDATVPFYSIGIHPWYINIERLENDLKVIENKLEEHNCLAIGECGLDKRIDISLDLQQMVFEKQLALAQQYQKPVIIHCVAAFQELIETIKRLKITVPIIIHGFSKGLQLANQLLENGFYISFGKYLMQNPDMESVFKSMPPNRLFLETDTIEAGIESVYEVAAKYRGIDVSEIKEMVSNNFFKVFKIEIP